MPPSGTMIRSNMVVWLECGEGGGVAAAAALASSWEIKALLFLASILRSVTWETGG